MNDDAKKMLKEQFKKRKAVAGVFCIETKDGLCFAGAGTDVESLLNRHRTELNFGTHRNKQLQNEWNREKGAGFSFVIVEELKEKENSAVDIKDELKILLDICISEMTKEGRIVGRI